MENNKCDFNHKFMQLLFQKDDSESSCLHLNQV